VKIHSSSLAYYPASINQSQSAKSSDAGINDHELNAIKEVLNQPSNVILSTDQLKKELESFNLSNNIHNFINLHAQKALTAYTDSANQPQHEQRSQLTNIDFYI